jgi:hypothetical protein
MHRRWPAPLVALVIACGPAPTPDPEPEPTCNGHADLCARRFDEVAYPTTHNAMANEAEGWQAPNQYEPMAVQLEDGVRGLMLDAHPWRDDVYLCHGACELGHQRLADGLGIIRDFVAAHPHEVLTIIFESYVSSAEVEGAFEESGLHAFVHVHEADAPWPTLEAMIDSGRRVVVLTDRGGSPEGWYLDVWAHAFETHWAAQTAGDLSCAKNRGDEDAPLFILNHFLTDILASPELAETVNYNPFFLDRARDCAEVNDRLPNFPTVDYYEIGDLFAVVDALNGL